MKVWDFLPQNITQQPALCLLCDIIDNIYHIWHGIYYLWVSAALAGMFLMLFFAWNVTQNV